MPAGEEAVLAGRIRLGQPREERQRGHPVVPRELRAGHAVERPFPERVVLLERQQFLEDPLLGRPPFEPPQRLAPVVERLRQQIRPLDARQRAQRGAQPAPVVFRHPDAQPHQLAVRRRGEPPRDLQVVLVRPPVVPGPREPRRPPHRPRVLLGGRRGLDVAPLVERRELPPRGKRLPMRRHVVVQDLQRPRRLLAPSQPLQRRRLRGQRLTPQREAPLGNRRVQVDQRLFPVSGTRQPPPQIEPQAAPVPVLRELLQHPPQQRDPVPPPHPRKAPAKQVQRIRRQLAPRQFRRSQPLLRFRPPTPPKRVRPQPVRRRRPGPRREGRVIRNRRQRLLPVRPRRDRRRPPDRRQPVRQFLKRLPGNPRERLGRAGLRRGAGSRNRQEEGEGSGGVKHARREAPRWRRRLGTPTSGRHSPPKAGGARIATRPDSAAGLERRPPVGIARTARETHHTRPHRSGTPPQWRCRLGTPTSGRHRAGARNPPRWRRALHDRGGVQQDPITRVPPGGGP